MSNKQFSIHPIANEVRDNNGITRESNGKSHGHTTNKPTGPTLITDARVIVSYKVGGNGFLNYNGDYYAVNHHDFYIEYNDDLSIKVKQSSDNTEISKMVPKPGKTMMSDIEYIVISHVEGSTWKLVYFNGRYYWIQVG